MVWEDLPLCAFSPPPYATYLPPATSLLFYFFCPYLHTCPSPYLLVPYLSLSSPTILPTYACLISILFVQPCFISYHCHPHRCLCMPYLPFLAHKMRIKTKRKQGRQAALLSTLCMRCAACMQNMCAPPAGVFVACGMAILHGTFHSYFSAFCFPFTCLPSLPSLLHCMPALPALLLCSGILPIPCRLYLLHVCDVHLLLVPVAFPATFTGLLHFSRNIHRLGKNMRHAAFAASPHLVHLAFPISPTVSYLPWHKSYTSDTMPTQA